MEKLRARIDTMKALVDARCRRGRRREARASRQASEDWDVDAMLLDSLLQPRPLAPPPPRPPLASPFGWDATEAAARDAASSARSAASRPSHASRASRASRATGATDPPVPARDDAPEERVRAEVSAYRSEDAQSCAARKAALCAALAPSPWLRGSWRKHRPPPQGAATSWETEVHQWGQRDTLRDVPSPSVYRSVLEGMVTQKRQLRAQTKERERSQFHEGLRLADEQLAARNQLTNLHRQEQQAQMQRAFNRAAEGLGTSGLEDLFDPNMILPGLHYPQLTRQEMKELRKLQSAQYRASLDTQKRQRAELDRALQLRLPKHMRD